MVEQAGGWCAPSACAAGVCGSSAVHDDDCGYGMSLQLPQVSVPRRGGVRFPRFAVNVVIQSRRDRWWGRLYWEARVGFMTTEGYQRKVIGTFRTKAQAEGAAEVVKRLVEGINEAYRREREKSA